MAKQTILSVSVFALLLIFTGAAHGCWACKPDGGGGAKCVSTIPYGASHCNVDCNPAECTCQVWGVCDGGEFQPNAHMDCDEIVSAHERRLSLSQDELVEMESVHPELGFLFQTLTRRGENSIPLDTVGRGVRIIHSAVREAEPALQYEYAFLTRSTPDGVEFIWQFEEHPELARIEAELFVNRNGALAGGVATLYYLADDRSVETLSW
jgi:hypothetical protein